jgi:hypothetical protein
MDEVSDEGAGRARYLACDAHLWRDHAMSENACANTSERRRYDEEEERCSKEN